MEEQLKDQSKDGRQQMSDFLSKALGEGLASLIDDPELRSIVNMSDEELEQLKKREDNKNPTDRVIKGNNFISKLPVYMVVGTTHMAMGRYLESPTKENLDSVLATTKALLSRVIIEEKGLEYMNAKSVEAFKDYDESVQP